MELMGPRIRLPSKIQVGPAIQIQFIGQHAMNRFHWGPLLRDAELWDNFPARIA